MTFAALLRAVNVGGHSKLPMKQLAVLFEQTGCSEVRTFIQSGNVVFKTSIKSAQSIPLTIPKAIEAEFGFRPVLVLRSLAEMESVVRSNPFTGEEDGSYVFFLEREPGSEAATSLDPNRSPGDRFELKGKELYAVYGTSISKSKLTGTYVESKLGTAATARNWRTVTKLFGIMQTVD